MGDNKRQLKCKKSIRSQMTVGNFFVIILVTILIEISLTVILVHSLIKDRRETNRELVCTMSNSFDDMWLAFKWTLNSITMDETFQTVLSGRDQIVYENGEDNAELLSVISSAGLFCKELDDVYVYDRYGNPKVKQNRLRSGQRYNFFPELQDEWFEQSGKVTTMIMDGRLVFTRIIYDMTDLQCIGYILCVYNESALYKRINTVVPTPNRFVAVMDSAGDLVTHNYPEAAVSENMFSDLGYSSGDDTGMIYIDGIGRVLAAQHDSEITGWRTISVISLKDVLYAYADAFKIIAFLGVLAVCFSYLLQRTIAGRITRPLESIVHSITQAREGDYSERISVGTEDEIAVLADEYNNLMERTDILINQVLKGELAYRDAQLTALQSQINPHMLFNTLDCLNWLAEYGRKDDIRTVTTSFSKLMHAMMAAPSLVSFEEELDLTENFLLIYKILLGDKLNYTVEHDGISMQMHIPRLTIQPLVENAVIHGIRPAGGGNVNVVVASALMGTVISVIDDGAGISEMQITAINAYAQGSADQNQNQAVGMGFRNVIDRLHLMYGDSASFKVSGSTDFGTVVSIMIPGESEE